MIGYNKLKDAELVELLKTGDNSAYTEIYTRYDSLLYYFAFRRLGDREVVKDIVQEVFLSLWLNHENINLEFALNTYLYSAVRNKIIDAFARKKLSEKHIESFNMYKVSEQNNTDHLIRHKELHDLISREINALPSKMRRVYDLSRKNELTRKQIAEELGLSEQTVKSHMHHALKILKNRLSRLVCFLF